MKSLVFITSFITAAFFFCFAKNTAKPGIAVKETAADTTRPPSYFIDVHDLERGKIAFEDVAKAHRQDLAIQGKCGVHFLKFWVDEKQGKVYCLSQAGDSNAVKQTHKEAHGLMPAVVYNVTDGQAAAANGNKLFFIDVHEMGAGKVTAKDVAGAHAKDLQVQDKYGVNFINYWVDEKKGTILCLSEAADSNAVKKAHAEAHGLLPAFMLEVKQGQ